MSRTRTIIAGVQDAETARSVANAGADGVGLVFVPGSPRYVTPESGFEIVAALPPLVSSVGIFSDISIDDFADVEQVCPTALTIFTGEEDVETVCGCGPDLVKTVAWTPTLSPRDLLRWANLDEVSAILIHARGSTDGRNDGYVDWTSLRSSLAPLIGAITKPVLLGGGLTPENVGEVVDALRPYAVLVCRGAESDPSRIDPRKVEAFCKAVQARQR